MKWILGGVAAYGLALYLYNSSYNAAVSACAAQTFPNAPAVNGISLPQIGAGPWCSQYNAWESQWGWFSPFVPKLSL